MDAGVEIYKKFYPWPSRFRLGDPVLVKEVTGMSWPEFVAALDEQDRSIEEAKASGEEIPEADQVIVAGLIAVAFWQGNPHMTRDKARRSLERIPMEELELVGEEDEDDAVPPAEAGEKPALTSSESEKPQVE